VLRRRKSHRVQHSNRGPNLSPSRYMLTPSQSKSTLAYCGITASRSLSCALSATPNQITSCKLLRQNGACSLVTVHLKRPALYAMLSVKGLTTFVAASVCLKVCQLDQGFVSDHKGEFTLYRQLIQLRSGYSTPVNSHNLGEIFNSEHLNHFSCY
jgi:hypothetical protein